MSIIEALILGLVQGLTEFLPVSSSGHLAIGKELLGVDAPGLTFEVVVHAATVMSTIVVFRKDIISILKGLLKFKKNSESTFAINILISMIPVFVIGIFFKDQVEAIFGEGLIVVGASLLVTAVLLFLTTFARGGDKPINGWRAFVVGVAQSIAVLPGLSRSGATISTGLLLGLKREEIARFSFLMVLVPVLGEALLDTLAAIGGDPQAYSGISPVSLAAGFVSAFVAGLVACKIMIALVKRAKLYWFALYCAIVAVFCLIYSL